MVLKLVKNSSIVIVSFILSYVLAIPTGAVLGPILNIGGSFLGNNFEYFMFGLPLGFTVLTFLSFSALGDRSKYWWVICIALIIGWFEVQLTSVLLLISLVLAGTSWWTGTLVKKQLLKLAPGVMAKLT